MVWRILQTGKLAPDRFVRIFMVLCLPQHLTYLSTYSHPITISLTYQPFKSSFSFPTFNYHLFLLTFHYLILPSSHYLTFSSFHYLIPINFLSPFHYPISLLPSFLPLLFFSFLSSTPYPLLPLPLCTSLHFPFSLSLPFP